MSASPDTALAMFEATPESSRVVGLYDRLDTVHQVAGFYPTSRAEINEAFGLLDGDSLLVASARHMYEIYRHQQKADTEDPAAAVRSVTNLYAGYARRARTDLTFLGLLQGQLSDPLLVNHRQSLADIGTVDGLGQMARFGDLRSLARTQTTDGLPFDPLETGKRAKQDAFDVYTSTTPSTAVKSRLALVAGTSIHQALGVLPDMLAEQQARNGFWVRALEGAARYRQSRTVAATALQSLGVRR